MVCPDGQGEGYRVLLEHLQSAVLRAPPFPKYIVQMPLLRIHCFSYSRVLKIFNFYLCYVRILAKELSKKAKLSIFKAVLVPILPYGHESWVMTERMRSQVQASEMRFLRRIKGVTLFIKVRSSEIRKSLNIEP